jgi:hypothetical protein
MAGLTRGVVSTGQGNWGQVDGNHDGSIDGEAEGFGGVPRAREYGCDMPIMDARHKVKKNGSLIFKWH